jgi:pyridoxal phosphate enzyme (YggS family)
MDSIKENLERVREKIISAALRAGRKPEEVTLLAVSKGMDYEKVRSAYESGQRFFGENYVQEALKKIEKLPQDITWHFIGRIQKNKVKYIIGKFALVHSVESISLCEEFQRLCEKKGVAMEILVEVNLSGETTKGGILPSNTLSFVKDVLKYKALKMKGLMTMPPYSDNPEDSRKYFIELRRLREKLIESGIPEDNLTHLSMGMSGDFEVAIEEGATIVRIGTAIFGART